MTTRPSEPWPAPTPEAPLDASVSVPGSKSMTNRAVLLSALADGTSRLTRPLRSRDTLLMAEALRQLGATIADDGDAWVVTGVPGPLRGEVAIDVGNAGTVARFLPPAATLAAGPVSFTGDDRMRERPLGPLLAALRALGARVSSENEAIPLTVHGSGGISGGAVSLDASASSQLVSGLLLTGARWDEGVRVQHTGSQIPSGPHLAMTVAMLRDAGAAVTTTGDGGPGTQWDVAPGPLQPVDRVVEPDLSSAAPFLAAGLVAGGTVTVADWPATSTQPGAQLPDLLTRMGARCELDDRGLTVSGDGTVRGLDVDLSDVGELTPVVAALAALADSPSTLLGVAHLRGQETDRLAALVTEINRLGGAASELPDGLRIDPAPLTGGTFATYDDHRMAMAAAVLGLRVPGIAVANVATTGKTVPNFVSLWTGMMPT